jgi:hypothetical protein
MKSQPDIPSSESPFEGSAQTSLQAAEVLLREHPDALLLTQAADGLVVPPPASLGLVS